MIIDGQYSFEDFLDSGPEVNPALHIGTFLHPGNLDDMAEAKESHYREFNTSNSNWKPYRGWAGMMTGATGFKSEHHAQCFDADLRCQHYWRTQCQCVGQLVYRYYCSGCDWWGTIHGDSNQATEEYLDHCWPGWRDLPVIESSMKPNGGYTYRFPEGYPVEWKIPGAPIRDCRGADSIAGRHVPGQSPYGGIKAAVIRKCKQHGEKERFND